MNNRMKLTHGLVIAITFVIVYLYNSKINAARIGGLFPPVVELSSFKKVTSTSTCGLNDNPMNYCLSSLLNTSVSTCTQRRCLMNCCSTCGTSQPTSVNLENGIQYQVMRITDTRPGSSTSQSKSFQTGSRIEYENIQVANIESRGISFTAWVKQLTGTSGALVSKGNSYALIVTQFEMYFIYTTKDSPSAVRNATIRNLNDYVGGIWKNIAFVVYGKDFSLFVDGKLQRSLTLQGFINDAVGTVTIGQYSGRYQFSGLMQEMKYFDKALTNREVIESMTGSLPSLFAYDYCRCPSSHPAISPKNSFFCMRNGIQTSTQLNLVLRLDPDAHPIEYTVDGEVVTYWLSEMTNEVTIDIDLKHQDLQVSIVQLQFYSPPAKGIRIDRSLNGGLQYQPWQYFASDCSSQYNLQNNGPLNEPDAVNCLQVSSPKYSWESITFRTHEPGPENMPLRPFGVPTCNDIYCSPKLMEFIKATNIRIKLSGHTLATNPNHQYFGVRRIIVGGSCDCFGHGSSCEFYDANSTHVASYSCQCDPRTSTSGKKCDQCLPLYNHKPFKRGTIYDAYPCVACPCNNHAEKCYYDALLDLNPSDRNGTTGGGVCLNCMHNTVGRFCQSCRDNYFLASDKSISDINACQPCNCVGPGVLPNAFSCQKDGSTPGIMAGQCTCKANAEGRQCERCKTGYYQLTNMNPDGCIPCGCSIAGTLNSLGTCNTLTGSCSCKTRVSGVKCDTCQVNYYGLSANNPEGCSPCSCDPWGSKSTFCEASSGQCICKDTTVGRRCNRCKPGNYDLSETGCRPCRCYAPGTDPAQPNTCNPQTGQCICRLHTTGFLCDRCKSGYFNMDTNNPLGCSECQCDSHGTVGNLGECELVNGNCSCKTRVNGRQCNICKVGNYNLTVDNPEGCMPCLCNPQGAVGGDSTPIAELPCTNQGQCNCLANIVGPRCTSCADQYYWNPTGLGCLQCSCDPAGSLSSTCNSTGYCICRQGNGIGGRRCDQCLPGNYNFFNGVCQPCNCLAAGSNNVNCDSLGVCSNCKVNVAGSKCDQCKPGTTNLDASNPFGCSGVPSQQSPPQVTIISSRSASITWRQPDNPNGFIIRYQLYKNNQLIYTGAEKSYTDTDLIPYTSYTYYILSFTAAGSTKSVDSNRVYRTPPDLAEGVPVITIGNILDRSVFASWQPPTRPNGIITSYSVQSTNNRDAITTTHYTGNALNNQITSLKPFTIYSFTLTVCNTVGCVTGLPVISVTRSSAPDSQPAPYLTSLPGGRSIFVYWDEPSSPNGNILFYDLYVREEPFNSPGKTVMLRLDPLFRNHTATSLLPYTEYEFRVTSYTAQVNGDTTSNWTRVRTLEDAPSGSEFISPTATAISATMINLVWNPPGSPNGIMTRYDIYRYEAISQFLQPVLISSVSGNLRSKTLDKFSPYTRYEFTMKACNAMGCTSQSFKTSATTLASAPSQQPAPMLYPLQSKSINASWEEPLVLNGPRPISYILERRQTSFYYPPPVVEIGRRFPGKGYMQLNTSIITDSASSRLQVHFKTTYANGLIFYAASAGQEDLIVLELRNGKPWFVFDTESGAAAFTVATTTTFNDGQWHKVVAIRDGLTGRLEVDDFYVGNGLGGGQALVIGQIANIFVGGLPNTFLLTRGDIGNSVIQNKYFVGCIKNMHWKEYSNVLLASSTLNIGASDIQESCPASLVSGLHFLGGGYARLKDTGFTAGSIFSIELKFRSQWNRGLLFAAFGSNNVFISIQYASNAVSVTYRSTTLSKTFSISTVGSLICDGNWHTFKVFNSYSVNRIMLALDGSSKEFQDPIRADVITNRVYIGGLVSNSDDENILISAGVNTQSFGGCLKDLVFVAAVNFEQQIESYESLALDGCPSDTSTFTAVGSCQTVTPYQVVNTQLMTYLDASLSSFTEFQYRIKSYQSGVSGFAFSSWKRVRTLEGVPEGLLDPEVTAIDRKRVNMTWSEPTVSRGLIIKYQLVAKRINSSDGEISVDVPDTSMHSYNITGLTSYTVYEMCYRVFTSAGSAQSGSIQVTTLPDVPELFERPTIDAGPTSLNISWKPPQRPNGRILFYQVELNDVNYYNGNGLNAIIENLQLFTSYDLRLAVCATGGCAWINLNVVTGQLPPEGVHAPILEVLGSRRMNVKWRLPIKLNGEIVKYEVLFATEDQPGNYAVAYTAAPNIYETILTSLIPGTFYYLRIAAYTGGGPTIGNVSTALTLEGVPEQIPPPNAIPISPQSIEVTILEPLFPNGIILSYSLFQDGVLVLNGTDKKFLGTGFLPFSRHIYRSRACTIKGCGTSDDIVVYTLDSPPIGTVNLTATVIGPRSVSAYWSTLDQPNGNLSYRFLATGPFYKLQNGVPQLYTVVTRTQSMYDGPVSAFPFTYHGLLPYSSYTMILNATNRAGFILSNGVSVTTPTAVPEGVTPPRVTSYNSTAILVRWELPARPNGAVTSYNLFGRYPSSNGNSVIKQLTSSISVTKLVDSLKPYTVYDFRISVNNSAGSTFSNWTSGRTKEAAPDSVDPPKIVNIQSHSVMAELSPPATPNGIIIEYVMYVNGTEVNRTLSRNILIGNLQPFTYYVFHVEACTNVGCVRSPNSRSYRTLAAVPDDMSPPRLTSNSSRSIIVTWDNPVSSNGPITSFDIQRRLHNQLTFVTIASVDPIIAGNIYSDTNLQPFTKYDYRIVAKTQAGGTPGPFATATTMQGGPDKVDQPQVTALSPTSLLVRWQKPNETNGLITHYFVKIPSRSEYIDNSVPLEYTLTSLQSYYLYAVVISACSVGGCTDSLPTWRRTLESTPDEQPAPVASELSSTSLRVRWSEPRKPNGPILDYVLYRRTLEDLVSNTTNAPTPWLEISNTLSNLYDDTNLGIYSLQQYRVTVSTTQGNTTSNNSLPYRTSPEPPLTGVFVSGISINHTTVDLSWALPPVNLLRGPAVYFTIRYEIVNGAVYFYGSNIDGDQRTIAIGGLIPSTNYLFEVTIFNGKGSAASNKAAVRTQDGSPEGFLAPFLYTLSSSEIRVSWQAPQIPNGAVQNYTIVANGVQKDTVSGSVLNHIQNGLLPYTVYQIKILVCTVFACVSTPSSQTRTDPAAPANLKAPSLTALSSSSISLAWIPPTNENGIMTGYHVYRRNAQTCPVSPTPLAKCTYIECTLQEQLCGTKCYDPRFKQCCQDTLYDIDATKKCCQSSYVTLNAPTDICCGGQFYPKQDTYQCCYGNYQRITSGYTCCNGASGIVVGVGNSCCGDVPYDSNGDQICICDALYTKTIPPSRKCCGGTVVPFGQVCCGTGTSAIAYNFESARMCCGDQYVLTLNALCCQNSIGQTKIHNYNSALELGQNKCCGTNSIPVSNGCCNSNPYNIGIQVCSDRDTTNSQTDCGTGTICSVNSQQTAYCNRCNFNKGATTCGNINGYYNSSYPDQTTNKTLCYTDYILVASRPNNPSFLSYTDTNLQSHTKYEYRITADNTVGNTTSPSSNARTLMSSPEGVSSPQPVVISDSLIVISWEAPTKPNGNIQAYRLYRVKWTTKEETQVYGGLDFNYADRIGLQPNTGYLYILSACTVSCTNQSASSLVYTQQASPEDVKAPIVISVSPYVLRVNWSLPGKPNGHIIRYNISILRDNDFYPVLDQNDLGDSLTTLVTNLQPYTFYSFRTEACTTVGCATGPISGGFTLEAPPEGLSPPRLTVLTAKSIEIEWRFPTSSNGIIQRFSVYRNNLIIFTGNTTLHQDLNVQPVTSYEYSIEVFNGGGSVKSNTASITTPESTPEGISPPQVNAISFSQLVVTWSSPSQPNGIIISYSVIYNEISGDIITLNSGLTRSLTISGLKPFTLYEVRISACTAKGCGTGSRVNSRTLETNPTGQQPPILDAKTSDIIEVSWKPPLSPNGIITRYEVERRLGGANGIAIIIYMGLSTEYIDTQLASYTVYEYRVLSRNSIGFSQSSWASSRTLEGIPTGFSDIVIVTTTSTSATLQWNSPSSPNGIITSYEIIIREFGNTVNETIAKCCLLPNTRSTMINNLTPAVTYELRLAAVNGGGKGTGNWVIVRTAEAPPQGLPTLMADTNPDGLNDGTSLRIYWQAPSAPNGDITGYTLYEASFVVYQGITRETVVRRLSPYSSYTFQLRACNSAGCTLGTSQVIFTAEVLPTGQSPPILGTVTANTVLLTWKPPQSPNGVVIKYEVIRRIVTSSRRRRDTETVVFSTTDVNNSTLSFTDTTVQPFTTYEYKIRVVNSAGIVDSDWIVVTTKEGPPTVIGSPRLTPLTDGISMVVQWDAPTQSNGAIQYYLVHRNDSLQTSTSGLTYTDTGLQSNTLYAYTVSACTSGGCSKSLFSYARTLGSTPSEIQPPVLSAISSSQISASWIEPISPNGVIIKYQLRFAPINQILFEGFAFAYTVSGLSPFTEYKFTISACTSVDCVTSTSSSIKTLETSPTSIAAPTLFILGAREIQITWAASTQPNGIVRYYTLRRENQVVYNGTDLRYVDRTVQPGTRYGYGISVSNSVGSITSPISFITTSPGVPEGIQVPTTLAISSTQIQVSWLQPSQPNGVITSYIVQYTKRDDGSTKESNGGLSFSLVVGGLKAYTLYEFRVKACTIAGCASSLAITSRTNEASPTSQSAPYFDAAFVESRSVLVQWLPPSNPNGVITQYSLYRRLAANLVPQQVYQGIGQAFTDATDGVILPNTAYEYQVVSSNTAGSSSSVWSIVTTKQAPPENVQAITIKQNGIRSTGFDFDIPDPLSPNGVILNYILDIIDVKNITLGRVNQGTADGLMSYTNYTVQLYACNLIGCGKSSSIVVLTGIAAPSGFDTAPVVLQVTSSSVFLEWMAPSKANGPTIRYELERYLTCPQPSVPDLLCKDEFSKQDNDVNTFMNSTGLKPYTRYHFKVRALNSAGSQLSPNVSVITLSQAPRVVIAPEVTVAGNTVTVNWTQTFDLRSKLIEFTLEENNVLAFTGSKYIVDRPNREVGDYSYVVRAFTEVNGITVDVTSPLVKVSVGLVVGPTAGERGSDTVWYKEIWFLALIALICIAIIFVCIVLLLRCCNNTRTVYIREREPLPSRAKSRIDSRGESPLTWDGLSEKNYPHLHNSRVGRSGKLPLELMTPNVYSSSRDLMASNDRLPHSRIDDRYSYGDEDDPTWDGYLKSGAGSSRMADRDSGLYDDDKMSPISNEDDDDDDAQGYHTIQHDRILFPDTHL